MRSLGPAGWASHGFFGRGAKTFGNPGGALSGDGYFVNGQSGGPQPGGKIWTTLTTGFEASQDQFYRIYYLNNRWLITTTTGTPVNRNTVIVSTDGIHWTQHVVQNTSVIRQTPGASFGAGTYIVSRNVNGGAPLVSSSTSLIAWVVNPSSFSTADQVNDPVFGNGVFLLVSNSTPAYATSPDGLTWTQQTAYVPTQWGQPVFDGTRFVCPVMGVSNTPKIAVSADGVNWTESAATLSITDPTVLGFNASTQYVVGEDSDDHGDSVNGALTVASAVSFNDANGPSGWIAYGTDWARCTAVNASVSSSPGGTSWGTDTLPAAAAFITNMAWNGAEWIAVGFTGAAQNFSMTRGP